VCGTHPANKSKMFATTVSSTATSAIASSSIVLLEPIAASIRITATITFQLIEHMSPLFVSRRGELSLQLGILDPLGHVFSTQCTVKLHANGERLL